MCKFSAALAAECIFDSREFDTVEELVDWAEGRGGRYVLYADGAGSSTMEPDLGVNIKVDDRNETTKFFVDRYYNYEEMTREEVVRYIKEKMKNGHERYHQNVD